MSGSASALPPRWQRALALLLGAAAATYVLGVVGAALLPALGVALQVVQPLIVAFAIAYLLDPLVDRFETRGWPRPAGIAMVIALALVSLGLLVVLVIPSVMEQASGLGPRLALYGERAAAVLHRLGDWLGGTSGRLAEWLRRLGMPLGEEGAGVAGWLERATAGVDWPRVGARLTGWAGSAASGGAAVAGFLLHLVLVPILAVYLLADIDRIKARMADLVPPRHRERVLEPLREIDLALSGFVRGQLTVAAILAGLYMLGLAISGTPLGLVIGLIAGAISFVPYLGIMIGMVPALLLTALEHGLISGNVLGVLLTFSIAQLLEGNVITPRVMGRSVGLHPVIVILAVVAGGTLAGVLGMLLAVPTAACAVVVVRRAHRRYVGSPFYRRGAATPGAPGEPPGGADAPEPRGADATPSSG